MPETRLGKSPAERYCELFRDIRGSFNQAFADKSVDPVSATAQWILQLAYQSKVRKSPTGKRVVFADNFYTRHTMAKKLMEITDGEIRMTETIKMNNGDAINRVRLKEAIMQMKDAERGSWMLVRAYDKPNDYDRHMSIRESASPKTQATLSSRIARLWFFIRMT